MVMKKKNSLKKWKKEKEEEPVVCCHNTVEMHPFPREKNSTYYWLGYQRKRSTCRYNIMYFSIASLCGGHKHTQIDTSL